MKIGILLVLLFSLNLFSLIFVLVPFMLALKILNYSVFFKQVERAIGRMKLSQSTGHNIKSQFLKREKQHSVNNRSPC